jgi:hypothetical protein
MKFSPVVALVLGAILAAAEAVNLAISMSTQAHDAITLAVTLLSGLGVLAATPTQIIKDVPHQVLVAITAVLGVVNVVQTSSFSIDKGWHIALAVVIVIGNTLFTTGSAPASPAPKAA